MPIGFPADADAIRKHSTWFIVYGVLMVLLGLFSIALPGVATVAVTLTIGWLLLIGGGVGLFAVISGGRSAPDFWWNLFTTILYILAGLAVLTRPMAGVLTLTIVLAAYLLAGGIMRIFLAVHYRARIPKAWVWVLISGVVDIVLSAIIMMGLPGSAVWVLGLLVGINLLMMGFSLIMVAMHERRSLGGPDTHHAGAKPA